MYIAQLLKDLEAEVLEQERELYKLRGEYSECTVILGRAIFALRMVAGIDFDLPENQNGPVYAYACLKKHDLIADQGQFTFDEEEE